MSNVPTAKYALGIRHNIKIHVTNSHREKSDELTPISCVPEYGPDASAGSRKLGIPRICTRYALFHRLYQECGLHTRWLFLLPTL